MVVERPADIVKPDAWVHEGRCIIRAPPDSMTSTCAPEADNSAARTEPAAPAPTTMKSYRSSSFDTLVILNPPDLKSDFSNNRLERSTTVASRPPFRNSHP